MQLIWLINYKSGNQLDYFFNRLTALVILFLVRCFKACILRITLQIQGLMGAENIIRSQAESYQGCGVHSMLLSHLWGQSEPSGRWGLIRSISTGCPPWTVLPGPPAVPKPSSMGSWLWHSLQPTFSLSHGSMEVLRIVSVCKLLLKVWVCINSKTSGQLDTLTLVDGVWM